MSPAEQLGAARSLIADPGAWCQNALARCPLGRPVAPRGPEAASRCGIGALLTVGRLVGDAAVLVALDDAVGETYAVWQDRPGRTQVEVLAAFDRAIAALDRVDA